VKYKSFFINLADKSCFVVGGNKKAAEIAKSLLYDDALLTIWSDNFVPEFKELLKEFPARINLLQAEFSLEVAEHYTSAKVKPFIVITALSDLEQNERICDVCLKNNVLSYNPNSPNSEVLIHDNVSLDSIEIAINIKNKQVLTRLFQNKIVKLIKEDWLDAIEKYQDFQQNEFITSLDEAEKRIIMRRLAEEIIRNDGDFALAEKETKSYYSNLINKDELLLELADERSQMD